MSSEAKREVWVVEYEGAPVGCSLTAGALQPVSPYVLVRYIPKPSTPAAKAGDGWMKDLANILDRLDHAETLHANTMRFQYQYACDDLGAHLAMHREELRAALGIPAPPSPETNGEGSDG